MDRARRERRVAEAGGRARRIHSRWFSVEHGSHLAVVLSLALALPVFAQDEITFQRQITQEQFTTFSRLIAQSIYATPVQPARASGILGFDVGIAATMVEVDTDAPYWRNAVPASSDFTRSGYAAVPRLVAAKGFGFGTVAGTYAQVSDSTIKTYGASLDLPIIRGNVALPEIAVRGAYSTLTGIDVFDLKTFGVEVFISKGFGPFTPYGAVGKMRSDATGRVPATAVSPAITLTDQSTINRFTAGLRLSLLVPKITVEATQAEVRSYAAKISFGW